jgi:hypothetical protein
LPCPPPIGTEGIALSFFGSVPVGAPITVTYDLQAWLRGWDGKDPAPWTTNPGAWTAAQISRAKEAARILATFAAIDAQGPASLRDALASQFGLTLTGTVLTFSVLPTTAGTSVVDVQGSSLLGVRIEVTLTAGNGSGAGGTGTGGTGTGGTGTGGTGTGGTGTGGTGTGGTGTGGTGTGGTGTGGTGTGGTGTGGTGTGGTGTGGTGTGGTGTGGTGTGGTGTGGTGTGGTGTDGSGTGGPGITPPSVGPDVPTLLQPPIDPPLILFPGNGMAPPNGPQPDDRPFVMAPIPASLLSLYGSKLINTYGTKLVSNNGSGIIGNNGGGIISDQASGIVGHVQAPFKPDLAKYSLLAYTEWPWPEIAQMLAIDVPGAPIATPVFTDTSSNYHIAPLPSTPEIVFVLGKLGLLRLRAMTAAPANGQSTADVNTASTAVTDWVLDEIRNERADLTDVSLAGYAADRAFITSTISQAQAQWICSNDVPTVAAFVRGAFAGAGYTPKTLLYGMASTYAGSGAYTSTNGPAPGAGFRYPYGVAFDATGNLVTMEVQGYKVRAIAPGGGAVSTIAGTGARGATNGPGASAQFWNAYNVAIDAAGNKFVTDRSNNQIRKITPGGVVSTFAGSTAAGLVDATGTAARFNRPIGLAIDPAGNLYVGDTGNGAIRKITPAGVVTTYAGDGSGSTGYVDGPANTARFYNSTGLTVDSVGNVLVADQFNYRVRAITPGGQVLTVAGSGGRNDKDGPVAQAEFNRPSCVVSDDRNYIYVADFSAGTIRRIGPTGTVRTLCGGPGFADGPGRTARFANTGGITRAADGTLYVGDALNYRVRKVVLQH